MPEPPPPFANAARAGYKPTNPPWSSCRIAPGADPSQAASFGVVFNRVSLFSKDRASAFAPAHLMSIAALAFWIFAAAAVFSGLMVVASRNPVHSVLFLISAFISAAGLFVLMGAEYLAMLLIVVYVGAVAVLFLFVVMMLDVDFVEMKQGFLEYLPIGALLALLVVVELIMVVFVWAFPSDAELALAHPAPTAAETVANPDGPTNIEAIGLILYTDYIHYFQIAGMILLVAMIGAIVLTFRVRKGVKKQDPAEQVARRRDEGVELVDIGSGQGLS